MALVKRGPHHNNASPALRALLEFRMSFAGQDGLIFQNAGLCVLFRQIYLRPHSSYSSVTVIIIIITCL